MSTNYVAQVLDTDGNVTSELGSRSRKDAAIKLAQDHYDADNASSVRVVTEAGTVVFSLPVGVEEEIVEVDAELVASDGAVVSNRAKPWSRTETAKFATPEVEGYTLAYTRTRTQTAVYRANDKSGWLVLDTRTGETTETENTTEARQLTNALQAAYKVQVAKERDEAKANAAKARAEAKAAKDKVKADEAAAKQAAKEAKAAAKAAKDAEAEAEKVDA